MSSWRQLIEFTLLKQKKVLFIDASDQFQKGRAQNFFLLEHTEKILGWYSSYKDIENRAKVADITEIEENEFNLSISRYVKKAQITEKIDLKGTQTELEDAYAEFTKSEDNVKKLLKETRIL